MAEYTANTIQLVNANQSVVFTDTVVDGCDLIYHRDDSSVIKLFAIHGKCFTRFKVTFGANIAADGTGTGRPGQISIALTIDGEPVGSTTAIVTPVAVNEYSNVSSSTYIYVRHDCCATVGVRNTSAIPINVQNANIIITRE